MRKYTWKTREMRQINPTFSFFLIWFTVKHFILGYNTLRWLSVCICLSCLPSSSPSRSLLISAAWRIDNKGLFQSEPHSRLHNSCERTESSNNEVQSQNRPHSNRQRSISLFLPAEFDYSIEVWGAERDPLYHPKVQFCSLNDTAPLCGFVLWMKTLLSLQSVLNNEYGYRVHWAARCVCVCEMWGI